MNYWAAVVEILALSAESQSQQLPEESLEEASTGEQQVIDEKLWDMSPNEKVADITPDEASALSEQLWASGVQDCLAHGSHNPNGSADIHSSKLLLTFQRFSPLLEEAHCEIARDASAQGIDVKPQWADGAKVFTKVDPQDLRNTLGDIQFRPWHLLINEHDENKVFDAIKHLPYTFKKLKHDVGRLVISDCDIDRISHQANPDEDKRVVELQVARTSIHFLVSMLWVPGAANPGRLYFTCRISKAVKTTLLVHIFGVQLVHERICTVDA